jgi:hypothetical protein
MFKEEKLNLKHYGKNEEKNLAIFFWNKLHAHSG